MLRLVVVVGLAGCGDNLAAGDAAAKDAGLDWFTYHATVSWSPILAPQVTSVSIDNQAIAPSGYEINETYPTRDIALTEFAPRVVMVMTTTETLTFKLMIGPCAIFPNGEVTREEERYFVELNLERTEIVFSADCGYCIVANAVETWCS